MRKPNFFIVGAPKCGTTAMHHYLAQHPDIFMCPVKEPEFFGSDHTMINRVAKSETEYLSLFAEAQNETRIGEASIWYLCSKNAASEIKEFCPFGKIIIMLRNPVDMLFSLHRDLLYVGYEDIEDFEEAIETMEVRKRGNYIPGAVNVVQGLSYRYVAQFHEQVKRYFDIFGKDNVRVIILDDLKEDTAKVYQETLQFLDVNDDYQVELSPKNVGKRIRSKFVQKAAKEIWLNPTFQAFLDKMPNAVEHYFFEVFRFIRIKNSIRDGKLSPMKPTVRKRFQLEFATEVEKLSELLNRDLSDWNQV
ncbi:MAG: sulfotransferase [Chroococcales cyanobacterium]